MNGSTSHHFKEVRVSRSQLQDYDELLAALCQEMKERRSSDCLIFSLYGLTINPEDVEFIQDRDCLYLECNGRPFDTRQIIDQYNISRMIGEGGFGKVYHGTHKKSGQQVAVKYIDLSEYMKKANKIEEIFKEAKILMQLTHKNIIKLHQACVIENDICLIMEYADGGELVDYVREHDGISEVQSRNIVRQVASAMQHCHGMGVIHRDLKLENVLFETQARTRIKVVDFGISGLIVGGEAEKNNAATLKYMTPEMTSSSNSTASPAMDVWAIGIMLYSMLFNRLPFNGNTRDEIKQKICNNAPVLPRSKPLSKEGQIFLERCLTKNPDERITIEQMLNDRWMTCSDDSLEAKCQAARELR